VLVAISVSLADSVLIVIDSQIGFVNQSSAHAVPVIAGILSRWQAAGGLSVMTRFVNRSDSSYATLIGWRAMMPGNTEVEFAPEVVPFVPAASLVSEKTCYSGLTPQVMEFIDQHERRNLWIAGLDTESCVLATALDAFDRELTPWVMTDACASHGGAAVHDAGVLVMGRNLGMGQLVTTAHAPI
jgi:nicotinamidase-related amidase